MTARTRTARRACAGKHRHRTQAAAQRHRTRLIERAGAAADALVAYPCPAGCGGWHVGHREGRRRAR